jgi:hypothetical protein
MPSASSATNPLSVPSVACMDWRSICTIRCKCGVKLCQVRTSSPENDPFLLARVTTSVIEKASLANKMLRST